MPCWLRLKVHYGLYNSKASFILFYIHLVFFPIYKAALYKRQQRLQSYLSVIELSCRWHGDVTRWGSLEAFSIKRRTNPRRNPFITLCSPGAFLIRRNWIIHKRRGQVSVVNSTGVSPLSVAAVIFSPRVTDRGLHAEYNAINISSGHQFHFHSNTWLFALPAGLIQDWDRRPRSPAPPLQTEISCSVHSCRVRRQSKWFLPFVPFFFS